MKNFLKKTSLYGSKANFKINQKSKYVTSLDIVISIITYGFILHAILKFAIDILYSKNKTIKTSIISNTDQVIDFSNTSIITAFGLQNEEGIGILDESIFNITAQLVSSTYNIKTKNFDKKIKKLEIIPCNESNYKFNNVFFDNIDINTKFCFRNKSEILLQGSVSSKIYNYVEIVISKCNNSTSNVICKSPEKIDNIIDDLYFYAYLSEHVFTNENEFKPFEDMGSYIYSSVNSKTYKEVGIYYSSINYVNKWAFGESKEKYYAFDTYRHDTIFKNYSNKFALISISTSKNSYKYESEYYKHYEVFSFIYSNCKFVILLAKIIIKFLQDYLFKIHLTSYFNFSFFEYDIHNDNFNLHDLFKNNNKKDIKASKSNPVKSNPIQFNRPNNKISERKIIKSKFFNNNSNKSSDKKRGNEDSNVVLYNIEQSNNLCDSSKLKKKLITKSKTTKDSCFNILKIIIRLVFCNQKEYYLKDYVNKIYKNISLYFDIMRFFKLYNDTEYLKKKTLSNDDLSFIDNIEIFSINKMNIVNIIKNKL